MAEPMTKRVGDCGNGAAVPFFMSFQIFGSFVILNLIVAVILENFSALGKVNADLVSTNDIEVFKDMPITNMDLFNCKRLTGKWCMWVGWALVGGVKVQF